MAKRVNTELAIKRRAQKLDEHAAAKVETVDLEPGETAWNPHGDDFDHGRIVYYLNDDGTTGVFHTPEVIDPHTA